MDFIKNKPWITGVLVVVLLVGGWAWFGRQKMSVTVTGTGSMVVPVGQVSLVVTAAASGNTAGDAITYGETLMLNLVDVTKKMMGNDTEIRKSFYQLTPETGGKFVMANAISIKSSSVIKTSDLIRSLFANGANTVSAVTFIPKDIAKVEDQVRSEAIKNARVRADVLAKVTGKKVGNLVSITDDDSELGGTVNDNAAINSNFSTVRVEKKISVLFEIY